MDVKDVQVIVVGAGISGVTAAARLLDHGFQDILILEAQNRIGGRIDTIPFGGGRVDLGGHWVGGQDGNPIYDMVKNLEVLTETKDFSNIHFVLEGGNELDREISNRLFELVGLASKDIQALNEFDGNLEEYFNTKISPHLESVTNEDWFKQAYLDWLNRFKCFEKGCNSLSDASTSTLSQYKTCSGSQNLVWKDGFSKIFDILKKKHPKINDPIRLSDENFKLGTEVTKINWSGQKVSVTCSNDQVYNCDHVIVTVSLGVLKEKHRTMFNPPLPYLHKNTINGFGIGTVNKIYLQYHTQWWPGDCSGFCFLEPKITEQTETSWENEIVGFFPDFNVEKVLCAVLVGNAAISMEKCSDETISNACTRVLKKFLTGKYDISDPCCIAKSKWYSNQYFRGSYSYISTEVDKFEISNVLSFPVVNWGRPMVLFAGEASSERFFSTTHGALESGCKAAENLINFYKT